MAKGILGRKVGMTQVYTEDGTIGPCNGCTDQACNVLQVRTLDRDGYEAVQLGYLDKKRPQGKRSRQSSASRSERGHVAAIASKRSKGRQAAGIESTPKADCGQSGLFASCVGQLRVTKSGRKFVLMSLRV